MSAVVRVRDVREAGVEPEDAWVRDFGPIFGLDAAGGLVVHDFRFNAWGGKYPPWDRSDRVPRAVAELLSRERGEPVPVVSHGLVLEGGSLESNGAGTLLTTAACLLHPNRNPRLTRADLHRYLCDALGARHVIWLPRGMAGDDTDGHQDDVARWLTPDTVAHVRVPEGHPDHAALEANFRALCCARDQDGRRLNLVALPAVDPAPTHRFSDPAEDPRLPASYANFLISNGRLFLPVFNCASDQAAIDTLAEAAPQFEVIPIRSDKLIVGRGALHCLSQQQPICRSEKESATTRRVEDAKA